MLKQALSKAVPGAGGYASASQETITYLKENARGYIFSGATSPFHTAVAIESIRHMQRNPHLVALLRENTQFFHNELRGHDVNIGNTVTPITPIMIGDAKKCVLASKAALEAGIHLFAIPFPVVPLGTSRLRASVSAGHTVDDLRWAARTIGRIARNAPSGQAKESYLQPTELSEPELVMAAAE